MHERHATYLAGLDAADCPGCCAHGTIDDHQIAADGTVTPSLVWPFDCGFHENVRLLNWPPEVIQ